MWAKPPSVHGWCRAQCHVLETGPERIDDGGDRGRIQTLLDLPDSRVLKEGYAFQHPVSPHWAAERDGVILDPGTLTLPEVNGPLVWKPPVARWFP